MVVSNGDGNRVRHRTLTPNRAAGVHRPLPKAIVADNPKLDHFPSLRPLSEQEKLLVRYVQQFPKEAELIAKEQAESENEVERLDGNPSPRGNPDQQQELQER